MATFQIISIFPEFFESPLNTGLIKRARQNGLVSFGFINPRDFTANKHRHIDDAVYGGGAGMLMQAPPIISAIRSVDKPGKILQLSPSGKPLTSSKAKELAKEDHLTLICGRYEGIDARINQLLPIEEISLGDVVLNGGETAALALIEAVCRHIPGFLGKSVSALDESFSSGLLEYDQYSRPPSYEGIEVPQILVSGHHAQITSWRKQNALKKTFARRPDLLCDYPLTKKDADVIQDIRLTKIGKNISFCLVHYPVKLEAGKIGTSSLTNLDIHDIARISRSYNLAAFYVLTPLEDQRILLQKILDHWRGERDRSRALELVRPIANFEEMAAFAIDMHGCKPHFIASSAQWPEGKYAPTLLTPANVRQIARREPVIICLGTARGLADEALKACEGQLRPLRFLDENHLSVRSAAAIIADRILGDFN